MKIEKINIYQLKASKYNPRQINKKQYKELKTSITKFGIVKPIVINKNFDIIGGHQRVNICKQLKHETIDCVVLDLSNEDAKELNIRLNKNQGTFDTDILANYFDTEELKSWGFTEIDFGFNIDKLTTEINESIKNGCVVTIKEKDIEKAKKIYNELKEKDFDVTIKM